MSRHDDSVRWQPKETRSVPSFSKRSAMARIRAGLMRKLLLSVAIIACGLAWSCSDRQAVEEGASPEASAVARPANHAATNPTTWPASIDRAVQDVLAWPWARDENQVAVIRGMDDDDLLSLHFGLGWAIRNELGLWQGNDALLHECFERSPEAAEQLRSATEKWPPERVAAARRSATIDADSASAVILRALRDHLVAKATPEEMKSARAARNAWAAEGRPVSHPSLPPASQPGTTKAND
jgi:hypothetical protein